MVKNTEILLSVKNLNKSYGNLRAVSDLCIELGKGEIFGLLGPNGAGKSTTIECILGTRKADSGSISLLGQSTGKDRKKLFQRVGVQFQDSHYPELIKVNELCEMKSSQKILTILFLKNPF